MLPDRLGGEEVELLEDHADAAAHPAQLPLERRDVDAVDHQMTARRRLERVDQPHQGRLAGAGIADDAEHVALGDLEGHVVDGDDGAPSRVAGRSW
jgi:hypothetical protein